MSLKLSYIVPAYNAEKTLPTFFEKLYSVNIHRDEYEVIVVDDCSTDNTWNLLKEYAAQYPNIVVLHQERNQRQGAARNRAISIAQGEYITCADIDDWVEAGMADALKEALHLHVDVLVCQTQSISSTGEKVYLHLDKDERRILTGEQFLNEHYHWHIPGAPWGYLIRREYMMKDYVPFVENRFHEDNDWILKQIYYAKSLAICRVLIYTYVENPASTVHVESCSRIADEMHSSYRIFQFLQTLPPSSLPFVQACREDRSYCVESFISRLWKNPDGHYAEFYKRLGKNGRVGLYTMGDNSVYGIITKCHLLYPCLSLCLLYTLGRTVNYIRHLIRNK